MPIIDTHAHIDQLEDVDAALARAAEAGVSDVVAMSVDALSMTKLLDIAARYTGSAGESRSSQVPVTLKVHAALGVHPGMIKPEEQAQAFDLIKTHIKRAIAVGETGLDYWYKWVRKDEAARGVQKESFAAHLAIAKAHDLPIVIHSRGAWKESLAMTKSAGVTRALFHWYSGPLDVLDAIIDAGYYVSTSPSVAYSPESRAAMERAPLERIFVETDSPVRYKEGDGFYNAEPKDVWRAQKALASLKNINDDRVLEQVNLNARDFFRI